MNLRAKAPSPETFKKISDALYSCKTVDQLTTVVNWVGRLNISKDPNFTLEFYREIEHRASILGKYIQRHSPKQS